MPPMMYTIVAGEVMNDKMDAAKLAAATRNANADLKICKDVNRETSSSHLVPSSLFDFTLILIATLAPLPRRGVASATDQFV